MAQYPRTRRSARTALKIGATLTGVYAFLISQALWARYVIGTTADRPPSADGTYGIDFPGKAVRVLLLGDSTAVGYGMVRAEDTPAAQIAEGMTHLLDAPVDMRSEAVVGATALDLIDQIAAGIDHRPNIAIILVGANDIRKHVRPAVSSRRLAEAIRLLRSEGCEVVVGTVPDLGTVKPILPPLRNVVRHWSRRLARLQARASIEAGARVVSVGSLLGPLFETKGDILFGEDRFHPSAIGYSNVSGFLVSAAVASWREQNRFEVTGDVQESIMSFREAAEMAADHSGTEVVRHGRLARVLRRRK